MEPAHDQRRGHAVARHVADAEIEEVGARRGRLEVVAPHERRRDVLHDHLQVGPHDVRRHHGLLDRLRELQLVGHRALLGLEAVVPHGRGGGGGLGRGGLELEPVHGFALDGRHAARRPEDRAPRHGRRERQDLDPHRRLREGEQDRDRHGEQRPQPHRRVAPRVERLRVHQRLEERADVRQATPPERRTRRRSPADDGAAPVPGDAKSGRPGGGGAGGGGGSSGCVGGAERIRGNPAACGFIVPRRPLTQLGPNSMR